jgi:hypothetical protein
LNLIIIKEKIIINTKINKKTYNKLNLIYLLEDKPNIKVFFNENNNFDDTNLFHRKAFRYFIEIVFGCAKGRLIQYSGTCYLNTPMNGFILSDIGKRIILNYMINKLRDDPTNAFGEKLRKPLSTDSCQRHPENNIFRIMYNIIFANQNLSNKTHNNSIINMMNIIAKQHFHDTQYNVRKTLISLLKLLDINNIQSYNLDKQLQTDIDFTSTPINLDVPLISNTTNKPFNTNYAIFDTNQITTNSIARCYLPSSFSINNKDTYSLVFGMIIYVNDTYVNNIRQSGHVMLGYFCDGVPKVFDSNGTISTADWVATSSTKT